MFSNAITRTAMRASTRQVVRSDLYHFSNSNGQNLPFSTKNKAAFGAKLGIYLTVGFAAPFLGCWWQFYKAG